MAIGWQLGGQWAVDGVAIGRLKGGNWAEIGWQLGGNWAVIGW